MRRRVVLSLALCAGISFQSAFGSGESDGGVDSLIQKARSLQARNRTDLAAQVWHQVLMISPDQPEALAALLRWAQQNGNPTEANAYLKKLRDVSPGFEASLHPTHRGPTQESYALLTKAGQLATAQRYEEAMQIYIQVFGSHPPDGDWALAYYQTEAHVAGHTETALQALRQLAQRYPNVEGYRVAVGSLLTYRPETRRAGVVELESVNGHSPAGHRAQQAWRQALVWEKQNPGFQGEMERYLARYPDPELAAALQHLRAHALLAAGKPTVNAFEKAGYEALRQGDFKEAEANFHSVLQDQPDSSRALAGLGFVHMKLGAFAEAATEFQAAIKREPTNKDWQDALYSSEFWATMQRGDASGKTGNWSKAIQEYQTALSLSQNHPDALRGLAGAYLGNKQPAQAVSVAQTLVEARPSDAAGWEIELKGLQQIDPKKAEERLLTLPDSLLETLATRPDFQILRALIAADCGSREQARDLLEQMPETEQIPDSSKVMLARLQIRLGNSASAVASMRKMVSRDPSKEDAWEALLSGLIASHKSEEAESELMSIPHTVQKSLAQKPGVLLNLASMDQALGNTDKAIHDLSAVLELPEASVTDSTRANAKIQLAILLSRAGFSDRAEELVKSVLAVHPDDEGAWKVYGVLLREHKKYEQLITAFGSMPAPLARRMRRDSETVGAWAEAETRTGNSEQAILLLTECLQDIKGQGFEPPATLQIQLAWLLLNASGREGELKHLLESERSRTHLTPPQRKELSEIEITWTLRSAEEAGSHGQWLRSERILEQGVNAFPQESRLKAAYAGALLENGAAKRAFNAYSNWGLQDAVPADYAGAIGAALAVHNLQYADTWIAGGLSRWPHDPRLLELAGDRAKTQGNLNAAVRYWREALNVRRLEASRSKQESATANGLIDSGPPSTLEASARPRIADQLSLDDELTDRIAGIESRNTPLLSSGVTLGGRNGQAGFDRLFIEQAEFGASAVLANDVRVTLTARPTYLVSGASNGQSTLSFGTLRAGSAFDSQHASGQAAETQISSTGYGFRLGSSPYGFLAHNFVGGLRLNPRNGPFTILLERDSVKDTLVSYSGARDPITHRVWGGVVSNAVSVQGHWGTDRSGTYGSTGYQILSGGNVAGNRAVTGNFGAYWKIATHPHNSLTVGANFSGMHYDKNLRYFTFGQGGYFSPQQYLLFGVPVHWAGIHNQRLQYSVGGSLGLQHFEESSSAFYPTDAKLQAATGGYYSGFASTGANFSFDGRVSYQIASQWFTGAFLDANNARDYMAMTGGFFIKYTFEPKALGMRNAVAGVPDWRGQQPLSLF